MATALLVAVTLLACVVTVARCDAKASHLSYAPEYVSSFLNHTCVLYYILYYAYVRFKDVVWCVTIFQLLEI